MIMRIFQVTTRPGKEAAFADFFHNTAIPLMKGTDGIVEAQNEDREPYGFASLEILLATLMEASAAEIQSSILATVDRHAGDRSPDDDRTIMVLHFDELEGIHTRDEVLQEVTGSQTGDDEDSEA